MLIDIGGDVVIVWVDFYYYFLWLCGDGCILVNYVFGKIVWIDVCFVW